MKSISNEDTRPGEGISERSLEIEFKIVMYVATAIIVVGLMIFYYLWNFIHYFDGPAVLFALASVLITTGLIALLFEGPYVSHHFRLAKNIEQTAGRKYLRSLIAGGDEIWKRLERDLIRRPFFVAKRADILEFSLSQNGKPMFKHYLSYVIKNNGDVKNSFEIKEHSYFNKGVESVHYESIRIGGKEHKDNISRNEDSGKIYLDFSFGTEIEEEKTESINILKVVDEAKETDFYQVRAHLQTEKSLLAIVRPTELEDKLELNIWHVINLKPVDWETVDEELKELYQNVCPQAPHDPIGNNPTCEFYQFVGLLPEEVVTVVWELQAGL